MRHSITIHCIGQTASDTKGHVYLYYAMNKKEIAQQQVKAIKNGKRIMRWDAQTKVGEKILDGPWCPSSLVRLPKMVTCPICKSKESNSKYYCPVCNSSGITTKGYEKRWASWQIEEMSSISGNRIKDN